jgi:hypothetical protein
MNGHAYRVIWRRVVLETRISGFMLDLMNRGESTEPLFRSMNQIDDVLARDPHHEGESRADFERVYFAPPLSVTYEVHDDERIVIILRARYVRPRHERG